jgi:putative DNA primase/helicase
MDALTAFGHLAVTAMLNVSVGEILEGALGIEPARWTRADQMRVTAYLKARNWERSQARVGAGRSSPREWRYRQCR